MKNKIILAVVLFLTSLFCVNLCCGKDLSAEDGIYAVAYKMAEAKCTLECRRKPCYNVFGWQIPCDPCWPIDACKTPCMDIEIINYISMLKTLK